MWKCFLDTGWTLVSNFELSDMLRRMKNFFLYDMGSMKKWTWFLSCRGSLIYHIVNLSSSIFLFIALLYEDSGISVIIQEGEKLGLHKLFYEYMLRFNTQVSSRLSSASSTSSNPSVTSKEPIGEPDEHLDLWLIN